MRYQDKIYIQNNNAALRNRVNSNVNMSSDVCVFNTPVFDLSGATKLDCSGVTSGTSYIVTASTYNIPLSFNFTANTSSFSATNANFKYEIYKYNAGAKQFIFPGVYSSDNISYSAFSGTNIYSDTVPVSGLSLDGEYIIKGFYNFDICTEYMNKLTKRIDTSTYKNGEQYGIYDNYYDFYFIAINEAEQPILGNSPANVPSRGNLIQDLYLPEMTTGLGTGLLEGNDTFALKNGYSGNFLLTLNGLTLAKNEDYSVSGNIITLNSDIQRDDTITVIYTTNGSLGLLSENILVDTTISSGTTGNEGSNLYFYNVTTDKYEVYTQNTPSGGNSIIVMINGATLANGIDYYQSKTNPKRIILVGDLLVGDLVMIAYFPVTSVINGVALTNYNIIWIQTVNLI
jgi:hypothetical protein